MERRAESRGGGEKVEIVQGSGYSDLIKWLWVPHLHNLNLEALNNVWSLFLSVVKYLINVHTNVHAWFLDFYELAF